MKAYIRGQTDSSSFSFPSAYYTYKVRKVFILSSNYLHNAFIIPATCVCPLKANWWDEVDPAKESSSDWTDWTIRASVTHTHRERGRAERGHGEREGRERGWRERERGEERERETVVPREVQRMCPVIINQAAADWRLWPSSSESFSSSWVWTLLNAEHTEGKSNGLW